MMLQRKIYQYLLLSSNLLLVVPLYAENSAEQHFIDQTTEACISKNSSTVGMMKCNEISQKQWDAELNRVYKALMEKLGKAGQAKLKAAQLQWIKYRDAEFASIEAIYGALDGTMWKPIILSAKASVVKERALTLQGILDLISS